MNLNNKSFKKSSRRKAAPSRKLMTKGGRHLRIVTAGSLKTTLMQISFLTSCRKRLSRKTVPGLQILKRKRKQELRSLQFLRKT